jgi:hypothetical protein
LFRGEQNIWKEDPATVTRGVGATARMEMGGSWTKHITVKNLGEIPEYIDLNETVKLGSTVLESHYADFWLNVGEEVDFTASGSETGTITLVLTIERSLTYPDPLCTYKYAGDLGSRVGSSNLFFVFDYQVTSTDVALLRLLFKNGQGAYPTEYYLGDLGSRVGSSNLFFVFDGQVTSTDVALLRLVFKGTGGP